MLGFLGPIIEERKKLQPEDRPNDFLTWVMNELEVRELDPKLTEKTKRETNTPYFMALMICKWSLPSSLLHCDLFFFLLNSVNKFCCRMFASDASYLARSTHT